MDNASTPHSLLTLCHYCWDLPGSYRSSGISSTIPGPLINPMPLQLLLHNYLVAIGAVVYPAQLPGPLLRAELIMSGTIPLGGFHSTTAVLPEYYHIKYLVSRVLLCLMHIGLIKKWQQTD